MVNPELKVLHNPEAVGMSFQGLELVVGNLDDCAGFNSQVSICRMSHKLSSHAERKWKNGNPNRNEISKFRRALEVVVRLDESGEDDETNFIEPVHGGDQSGI